MTFKTFVSEWLVEHGLWPDEAEKVVEIYSEQIKEMRGRMNDHIEGYPRSLLAAVLMGVRRVAVNWLEASKPNHFSLHLLKDQ